MFIINILFYWAKVFLKRTKGVKKVNIICMIIYEGLVCLDNNNCDIFLALVVNVFVNEINRV